MKNKNPKLLILVGPPGSGKSTYAKYHIRTEENWFRVSRDDFRKMQFSNGNMEQDEEQKLTKVVQHTIFGMLKHGMNVLVDATNTRKEFLNAYIKSYGTLADISFKVFDVAYDECKGHKIKSSPRQSFVIWMVR